MPYENAVAGASAARICRASAPNGVQLSPLRHAGLRHHRRETKGATHLEGEGIARPARERATGGRRVLADVLRGRVQVGFSIANVFSIVALGRGASLSAAAADADVQIVCDAEHLFHVDCLDSTLVHARDQVFWL